MMVMDRWLSRIGAALGNWNDRKFGSLDAPIKDKSRTWRVLDKVAGWLYVRGD